MYRTAQRQIIWEPMECFRIFVTRDIEECGLGATRLRGGMWGKRSGNDAWKPNLRAREVEAPSVRGAFVTRMGISMAVFLENFIGMGVAANKCPKMKFARQVGWPVVEYAAGIHPLSSYGN